MNTDYQTFTFLNMPYLALLTLAEI